MARTWVIGDIHGAAKALEQCLQRAEVDLELDHLIVLGDVCDGWPEVDRSIDLLGKIPRLNYILGNHDQWTLDWAQTGKAPEIWARQGGQATMDCYPQGMPSSHIKFLAEASMYILDSNRLFVHAGILPDVPLEQQNEDIFLWDRSLCHLALRLKEMGEERTLSPYHEIFIGHTPTIRCGQDKPILAGNVWMMDTGAGWDGPLTIMDVDTKSIYQSDPVPRLYPGVKGR